MNNKVVIMGAGGFLGSSLCHYLEEKKYIVLKQGRGEDAEYTVNPNNIIETRNFLSSMQPDCIVNLIGLTNVDYCENYPHEAYLINAKIVENISLIINEMTIKPHFIHISTDHVYDSSECNKEDRVNLTNYYAYSKYICELAAMKAQSTILRTNFFGLSRSLGRISFTDWIFNSLKDQSQIKVFKDVIFSPLYIQTLIEMIELCIRMQPTGIYNLGSCNSISKSDFAFLFASELRLKHNLMQSVFINDVKVQRAYRPKGMAMDVERFETALGVRMPEICDQIQRAAQEYRAYIT